jgi:hypothetical protein
MNSFKSTHCIYIKYITYTLSIVMLLLYYSIQ